MRYGKGALIAKFDLKRAYRAFPIRECDRYLLKMFWKDNYYGSSFRSVKGAKHISQRSRPPGMGYCESDSVSENDIQHFYDDFFEVGPPDSDQCDNYLDASLAICEFLGVSVEHFKLFAQPLDLF